MNRLKQLRESAGITSLRGFEATMKEHGVNVTYSTLQRFENGTSNPTWELVHGLARFFGVSADYLMGTENVTTVAAHSEDAKIPPEAQLLVKNFTKQMEDLYAKTYGTSKG